MEDSHANIDQQQVHSVTLTLQQYQATELIAIGKTDVEVAQILGEEIVKETSSSLTKKAEPLATLVDVSRFR